MRYVPLFILIQLVSAVLFLPGCVIVAWCLLTHRKIPKLWWNDEDGYGPKTGLWNEWVWLAVRNNVANLKYVPGVSGIGRPLWITNWTWRGKVYYAKAGWLSNGYPCMSFGAGKW